jgi:transposase InsO family protein
MAYRSYDHRVRNASAKSQNPDLFPELNIPKSTAKSWIQRGIKPVVTSSSFDLPYDELIQDLETVKNKLAKQEVGNKLTVTVFRIFGFQIQYKRLPSSESKTLLIECVNAAAKVLGLSVCLELIGLSKSRFSAWIRRLKECNLTDKPPCPKLIPWALTHQEINTIKNLVTSPEFAHFRISGIMHDARRHELLLAGEGTWYKVVKEFNLRRPFKRPISPPNQVGIKASRPNEIWHIDVTRVKLKDGTKGYLQAILDNFSRYVLAWDVSDVVSSINTRDLLIQALSRLNEYQPNARPKLIADGGPENDNLEVEALLKSSPVTLLTAMIEVRFSNSLIERFFYRLKKQYLSFQTITTVDSLREHCQFFIDEHNHSMPLEILGGAVPYEAFRGTVPANLKEGIQEKMFEARLHRVNFHRDLRCELCPA